jgi:hypothetical protein
LPQQLIAALTNGVTNDPRLGLAYRSGRLPEPLFELMS